MEETLINLNTGTSLTISDISNDGVRVVLYDTIERRKNVITLSMRDVKFLIENLPLFI